MITTGYPDGLLDALSNMSIRESYVKIELLDWNENFIQEIQGVALVNKGFLDGRNMYSHQLKSYLENGANLPNRTCAVFFSEKKSKLEKTYAKMKQKYQSDKSISCRMLDAEAFSFTKYDSEY